MASSVGADEHIISLFAFLHDSCRRNDGYDPEHGPRAAKYAGSIREILSGLEDAQFEILLEACNGHTSTTKTDNPTIAACWDADRLDLPRVGIRPQRSYFNTPLAIEMVTKRDFSPLESLDPRSMDTYPDLLTGFRREAQKTW